MNAVDVVYGRSLFGLSFVIIDVLVHGGVDSFLRRGIQDRNVTKSSDGISGRSLRATPEDWSPRKTRGSRGDNGRSS